MVFIAYLLAYTCSSGEMSDNGHCMNDMHGDLNHLFTGYPVLWKWCWPSGVVTIETVRYFFCMGYLGCMWCLIQLCHSKFRDFGSICKCFFNEKCQTMKFWCCVYAVMPKPIVTMVSRCFLSPIYCVHLQRWWNEWQWPLHEWYAWRPQSSLPKIPCVMVVLLTIWCGYHGNGEAFFLYGMS